jgi:hypothetical protein
MYIILHYVIMCDHMVLLYPFPNHYILKILEPQDPQIHRAPFLTSAVDHEKAWLGPEVLGGSSHESEMVTVVLKSPGCGELIQPVGCNTGCNPTNCKRDP